MGVNNERLEVGFGGPVRAGAAPTAPWVVATRRLSVGRGHCWSG